jgi:hypothetical protein
MGSAHQIEAGVYQIHQKVKWMSLLALLLAYVTESRYGIG